MLHDLNYYVFLAQQEKEEWEKLKDNYLFIKECYDLASSVSVCNFRQLHLNAKSEKDLESARDKVAIALAKLDSSSLNWTIMYTPITHIREQLDEIYQLIIRDLRNCDLYKREK